MKVKQKQIIDAYKVLSKIKDKPFTVKTAYALYSLRKELEPIFNFQIEEEQKAVLERGGTIDENGCITFDDTEKKESFIERTKELSDQDHEIKDFRIELPDDIELSMEDIGSLFPFISER